MRANTCARTQKGAECEVLDRLAETLNALPTMCIRPAENLYDIVRNSDDLIVLPIDRQEHAVRLGGKGVPKRVTSETVDGSLWRRRRLQMSPAKLDWTDGPFCEQA